MSATVRNMSVSSEAKPVASGARQEVRVVITGASGGIGAAATAALRAKGARVIGLDLVASGDDVIACDVTDADSVEAAIAEAAERLGGIDVLVNNAGIGDAHDAGAAPDDDALRVLDVNLVGPWRVTAAALPHLLASRGRLINIASGLTYMAVPFAAAYCMSKRGVAAYSDVLRLEYGDRLAPSPRSTPATSAPASTRPRPPRASGWRASCPRSRSRPPARRSRAPRSASPSATSRPRAAARSATRCSVTSPVPGSTVECARALAPPGR